MQGRVQLSTFKHYFIVVATTYIATEAISMEAVCQLAVAIMGGNTAQSMDKLEVQGNTLNSIPQFEKLFINQYAQLDNKNVAKDKLYELWQCILVQVYITAFDNMVVALPELVKEDTIHALMYSLNPCLKGLFEVQ